MPLVLQKYLQPRNVKHVCTLGETLADTFFLGVGVVHGRSELRKQNPLANSGKHTAVPVRNGQTKTKAILRKCLSMRNTFHQCTKTLIIFVCSLPLMNRLQSRHNQRRFQKSTKGPTAQRQSALQTERDLLNFDLGTSVFKLLNHHSIFFYLLRSINKH